MKIIRIDRIGDYERRLRSNSTEMTRRSSAERPGLYSRQEISHTFLPTCPARGTTPRD